MANQLGDAPTKRAQLDRDTQRTMLELRYLYGGAFDEDTQEFVKPAHLVTNWWRLTLARFARWFKR